MSAPQTLRYVVTLVLLLCLASAAPTALLADDEHPDVPGYVKALKSTNAAVRKQAATALGALGARAKGAVPALRAALLDADEAVQVAAAEALEKIRGPAKKPSPDAQLRLLQEQIRVAEEELEKTREAIRRTNQSIADRKKELAEALKKAAEADTKARATQERFEALTAALAELDKAGALKSTDKDVKRPAADVEGTVKEVDKSGLVMITIGADAGLEKGHTLHLYRLDPKPLYLGEVRIVEVEAKQATGRVMLAQRGNLIKKGDRVGNLQAGPKK